MGLSETDICQIETLAQAANCTASAVADLRQRFPALSLTSCAASDIDDATPFRAWPHLSLYLVDGNDHCWRLTDNAARATGLVIAAP
jgi:hypothetical protein